jgi:hypothetical protein
VKIGHCGVPSDSCCPHGRALQLNHPLISKSTSRSQ